MSSVGLQRVSLLAGTVPVAFTDEGVQSVGGQCYLLLHSGVGPQSMRGLASALLLRGGSRVIVPTHPGCANEPRPDRFNHMDDLALAYLALIDHLHLSSVVLVGSSMGGWLAAELAVRRSSVVRALVLLNSWGVDTDGTDLKIVDPSSLSPADRGAYAFHDQTKAALVLPQGPQSDVTATMHSNQRAVRAYCGATLADPTLKDALTSVQVPSLIVWGQSDRIVTEQYGRRLAGLIPQSRFEPVAEAGHYPHVEQTDKVTALIHNFAVEVK